MAAKKKNTQKGTRRSSLRTKRKSSLLSVAVLWGKRFAFLCVVFLVLCWGAIWFFLSDADSYVGRWVQDKTFRVTADTGYRVEKVLVEGHHYTDRKVLLDMIGAARGDPVLSFDLPAIQKRVEAISWVKSAHVERRLPDTLYVRVEERQPLALWKDADGLSLIDSDGAVLTRDHLDRFKDLLMVRGKSAPEHAQALLSFLEAEPGLKMRVDHARFIESRRWDLYLTDGKRVKLPESDVGLAVRHVMLRQEQDDILDKDSVTIIDARYQGRLIVRTKLGKVQDYKAGITGAGTQL